MADRWIEQLRCPICYKTGSAALSQEDDDHKPVAERIPVGFEVIKTTHGSTLFALPAAFASNHNVPGTCLFPGSAEIEKQWPKLN